MISRSISYIQQPADMPAPDMRRRRARRQRCVRELQVVRRLAVQQRGHQVAAVERAGVLAERAQRERVGG